MPLNSKEVLEDSMEVSGPIIELIKKVNPTEKDIGKIFVTDRQKKKGKILQNNKDIFRIINLGIWCRIGKNHILPQRIEKLFIMPNGREMTKTDLPGGGSIKIREKFWIDKTKFLKATREHPDADKIERMIHNFGPGPFLLFGILYFYQKRHKYFFLRFIDKNEKERRVNIKYCYK